MATARLGSVVSDIRGKIGDEVYGRNQGGIFIRERVDPTQTASNERNLRQAAITAISRHWSGTLTELQRSDWRRYAATWPLPDRWGRPRCQSGFNHFLRSNVQHYRITDSVRFDTPPSEGPAHPPTFGLSASSATNLLSFSIPPGTYPTPPTQLWLFAYQGHVVNPGKQYYSSPWRYSDFNVRQPTYWIKDPWTMPSHWTLVQGQRVFARMLAVLAAGETSHAFQTSAIIT